MSTFKVTILNSEHRHNFCQHIQKHWYFHTTNVTIYKHTQGILIYSAKDCSCHGHFPIKTRFRLLYTTAAPWGRLCKRHLCKIWNVWVEFDRLPNTPSYQSCYEFYKYLIFFQIIGQGITSKVFAFNLSNIILVHVNTRESFAYVETVKLFCIEINSIQQLEYMLKQHLHIHTCWQRAH